MLTTILMIYLYMAAGAGTIFTSGVIILHRMDLLKEIKLPKFLLYTSPLWFAAFWPIMIIYSVTRKY
jgi:hypothetical protein